MNCQPFNTQGKKNDPEFEKLRGSKYSKSKQKRPPTPDFSGGATRNDFQMSKEYPGAQNSYKRYLASNKYKLNYG